LLQNVFGEGIVGDGHGRAALAHRWAPIICCDVGTNLAQRRTKNAVRPGLGHMPGDAISYASWIVIVSACSGHNDSPLWASAR
jgi:hypothetical protein